MNAGKPDAYQCPTMADLSAWHDSELRDRALELHVANCPRCLRLLQSFRVIDDRALPEVTLDPAALQRIKCNCVRQIRQQPRLMRVSVVLRLAAVFVLAAAVLYFRGRLVGNEAPKVVSATSEGKARVRHRHALRQLPATPAGDAVTPLTPPLAVASASAMDETYDDGVPPYPELPPAMAEAAPGHRQELAAGNIRLVGYEDGADMVPCSRAPAPLPLASAEPAAGKVNCRVRHVWLVEEPAKPLRELGQLAPGQQADLAWLEEQHRPQYVMRLRLTDQELAALVDHFAEQGYKLLSPDAPQPQNTAGLTLTGRQVEYDLTLVQK